jgi:hypothetical protein
MASARVASERLTGALLDRLTHRVHILEMNGDSYRLAQSRKRKLKRPGAGRQLNRFLKTKKGATRPLSRAALGHAFSAPPVHFHRSPALFVVQ